MLFLIKFYASSIQGVPSARRPGLGWLSFGCSTILPSCLAASATFQLAQAESGRQWNTQNPSQPNPVYEHMGRASRGWPIFRHSDFAHSFPCTFGYPNVFECGWFTYIWPVSYKMSHIEAKSINIWLRYDSKCNLTICKECGHEVGLHFGSYLSQMLMDFASIWLIL